MTPYKPFDVIVVPFPYSDSTQSKRRPALVISGVDSFDGQVGHSICAMITSAKNKPWPFDVVISDLESSGLPAPSVVRLKLFTLDHHLVHGKIGALALKDRTAVTQALRRVIPLL